MSCLTIGTPESDLELNKAIVGATPANVGDSVTFEISVTNQGPDATQNVVVTDQLPAGLSYSSHSGDGSYASGSGIWTIGDLGDGATATLQITATVVASGLITNVAEVTTSASDDPDSTPDNDDGDQSEDDEDAASVTTPPAADLELTKAVSDSSPNVGDTVTYTITVSNSGPDNATGVAVVDTFPAGLSGVSNISNGGTLSGSTITWSGLAIADGGSLDLTYDAVVDAPTPAPGEYLNVAEVTASNQYDPDSTPNNDDGDQSEDDEDNAEITPQVVDVSLAKAVSNSAPRVGETVTFTLTVANDGPDDVIRGRRCRRCARRLLRSDQHLQRWNPDRIHHHVERAYGRRRRVGRPDLRRSRSSADVRRRRIPQRCGGHRHRPVRHRLHTQQ